MPMVAMEKTKSNKRACGAQGGCEGGRILNIVAGVLPKEEILF